MDKDEIIGGPKPPILIGNDSILRGRHGHLAAMMAMASMLGPMPEMIQQPRAEDDPRLHRPEKIDPAEFFITAGPGKIEGQFYACVMAPDSKVDEGYRVIAKSKYGFDDPESAKQDAAQQFPSVPVLQGQDSYVYPFYEVSQTTPVHEAETVGRAAHSKAIRAAEEKRVRRQQKLVANTIKSDIGAKKLHCPGCRKTLYIKTSTIVTGNNGTFAACVSCLSQHDIGCIDPWEKERAEDLGLEHDAAVCACRCHDNESTFTCDECGRTFDAEPGDNDDARVEAKENFPDLDVKDMARVCDDCFHELMKEQGHIDYAGSKG